jgi:hypothetical protein
MDNLVKYMLYVELRQLFRRAPLDTARRAS